MHLGYAFVIVALAYPWLARTRRHALKQRWSGDLLVMLGIELRDRGVWPSARCLIVANHVSWLDIYAVNALAPATFVCKDDVRSWPLLGWLVAKTGSIFVERAKRTATQRAAQRIRARLEAGDVVVVFPEGTTTDGSNVLPFHSGLLQAAIDAECALQPLAVRYTDAAGEHSIVPAYCGETTMWQSLWAVALASGLRARLAVLAPLAPAGNRRSVATEARASIARSLDLGELLSVAPTCAKLDAPSIDSDALAHGLSTTADTA